MNRIDPVRPDVYFRLRLAAKWLTALALGVALVLIFLPPLLAEFTSDTFTITDAELNTKKRELLGRM